MTLRYKICLFVVKRFEDYGIYVDRAELLCICNKDPLEPHIYIVKLHG